MSGTPYMNLVLPVPTATAGPTYAVEINTAEQVIDAHNHLGDGATGKQLGAASLNIDGDVNFNNHRVDTVKDVRMVEQGGTLGDVRALYANGGNLFYNDASGTPIQITASGHVFLASAMTGLSALNISGNHTIQPSDTYSLYNCDAGGGNFTLFLPLAASVGLGRWIWVQDYRGSFSPAHHVTYNASGSDHVAGASSGNLVDAWSGALFISDGISSWTVTSLYAGNETIAGDVKVLGIVTAVSGLVAPSGMTASGDVSAPSFTQTGTASGGGTVRLTSSGSVLARNAGNSVDLNVISVAADVTTVGDSSNGAGTALQCKGSGTVSMAVGSNFVFTGTSTQSTVSCNGSASIACTSTTVTVTPGGGSTALSCQSGKVGLYGATPIVQQTKIANYTDSTGGTPGTTLASVVGTTYSSDIPTIRNWIASLNKQINDLKTQLSQAGSGIGVTT